MKFARQRMQRGAINRFNMASSLATVPSLHGQFNREYTASERHIAGVKGRNS